jgi:hypothetical protein
MTDRKVLIERLATTCHGLDPVDPLRLLVDDVVAALREPEQEPVAWMYEDDYQRMLTSETFCKVWSVEVGSATRGETTVPLYTHPPQPEQEPVAWPCLIDSADFSENTITLVMQCEDYKVSAGRHWLSTTSPKENT